MKIFLMLLVALVAWWLLRGLFRDPIAGDSPRQDKAPATFEPAPPQDTMVACTHCQVHLPRSEAVWSGDQAFCGQAHLQAHEMKP
jgi:uncharacterized protein